MNLDVVFIAQKGELEVMASLLAASLRQYCGNSVHLHIIEPTPEAEYGNISYLSRKFLNALDVSWYSFDNPISDEYKIFNKLNAFKITPKGDKILFLDSDIFIRRPLAPLLPLLNQTFAARAAGAQRFSAKEKHWRQAYRLFDIETPKMRFPAWGTHEWGPPYFNAGVILADPKLDFSRPWVEACKSIHEDHSIKIKNRGTVQIGMPVALAMQNTPYAMLDGRLHFSLNKWRLNLLKKPWVDEEAHIVHYFHSKFLAADPTAFHEVSNLIRFFDLQDILALSERWDPFREKFEKLEKRNGTTNTPKQQPSSLVSNERLNNQKASLEKEENTGADRKKEVIVTGFPGAGMEEFKAWIAPHKKIDFPKDQDAQSLLPNLKKLAKERPDSAIFVLVKNPFDLIARWKTDGFDLQNSPSSVGIESSDLSDFWRAGFKNLAAQKKAEFCRAGLWDLFAQLADQHAENIHILRWEDIVERPEDIRIYVSRVLELDENGLPAPPEMRDENFAGDELSEWEKECIRVVCTNTSGMFEYNLYRDSLKRAKVIARTSQEGHPELSG